MKIYFITLLTTAFLTTASYCQVTYSTDGYGNKIAKDQYGNIVATYSIDGYGNTVKKDNYGNTLVIYSKDAYGNNVEKDQYGNIIATYSKDGYGETVKKDQYGNILVVYSKDAYGNRVEKDQNGNIIATYSKDGYGNTIKKDQYGNILSKNFNNMDGFNYDNSSPPMNFGKYINPINIDLVRSTLDRLENNPPKRYSMSEYDKNRMYVNEMMYLYDEKLLNKNRKKVENDKKVSQTLSKAVFKQQMNNSLYGISSLENGWYQVVSNIDENYAYKIVEVQNHSVVNWINSLDIKFPTSNLKQTNNTHYSLTIEMPDGLKTENVKFYFTSNKQLKKIPISFEPAIYILYTEGNIDGGTLYTRIYGDDINLLYATDSPWESTSSPKCNEQKNIIKFYLPKDKKFKFHSNTKTKFWKGEIITDGYCKTLNLK